MSLFDIKPKSAKDVSILPRGRSRVSSTGKVTRYSGGGTGGGGGGGWGTQEVTQYVKDLEQEQMAVANASHANPDSAEEGKVNPYEHNPHLQKYRAESAVVNTLNNDPNLDLNPKQPDDWVGIEGFRFSPSAFAKGYQDWDIGKQISATIGGGQRLIGEHLGYPSLVEKAEEEERLRKQYEETYAGDKHTDVTAAVDFPGTWGDLTSKDVGHFDESVVPMAAAVPVGVALAASLPATLPATAAGAITGLGSAAFGFAPPIAAKMYGDERAQGLSPDEALVETALKTSYEALPEALPFMKMFGPLGKNALTKIVSVAGAEAASEILTESLNIGHEIIRQGRTPTLEEVGQRLSKSAAMGFTMGTGFGTASAVPEAVRAVSNMRGRVPPVAPDGMPNLPVLPQGPVQGVDPSATGEPIDIRRRQFLAKARDMAQAAAVTRPSDLIPNLVPEAAVETAAAAIPTGPIILDYANIPISTNYVFEAGGKRVIAMTPHFSDIEQNPYIQLEDEEGGSDNLPNNYGGPDGQNNTIDLREYLEPGKEISQRDVDRAVASAVRDKLMQEDGKFVLIDVERYYDEMGNNADYPQEAEIENHEIINDPEGIFDEVIMGGPKSLTPKVTSPFDRRLQRQQNLKAIGERWQAPLEQHPDDPTGWDDQGGPSSVIESRLNRDIEAERKEEAGRIEEIARTKELTDQIPGLNELDQQLKSARDRLKSLEAGIPPEGFEDDYSAEEIAEDIEIEKTNIETIEEEIAIKKAEPLEGEARVVEEDTPTVDAYSARPSYIHPKTGRATFMGAIEEGSDLYNRIIDLYEHTPGTKDGLNASKISKKLNLPRNRVHDVVRNEKSKRDLPRPNLIYTAKEIREHYNIPEKEWETLTNKQKQTKRYSYGGYLSHKASGWRRPKDLKQYLDPGATIEELEAINKVFKARRILKDFLGIEDLVIDVDHSKQKARQSVGEYLHNANNLQMLPNLSHRVKNDLDRAARKKGATEEEIRASEDAFYASNPFGRGGGKGTKPWWDEIIDRNEDGTLQEYLDEVNAERWVNNRDAIAEAVSIIDPNESKVTNAYQDPEAKVIDEKKTAGKRKYVFSGKEHLPGIDYKRIIKKLNLRGRDTAEVHVEFAYVPNLDDKFTILIADEFIAGSKGKFGMAKERTLHGNYRIVINLARFDGAGVTEVIGEQAKRLGISPEELMEKIGKEKLQEYAIRSVLQHEITHVNHFAWERSILGGTGTDFSNKELGKFRGELYKAYRKEMIDFMRKDENAFLRLGLSTLSIEGKPVIIESNEEAIEFLDMLMRDAAKPAATSSERLEASKRVWSMFSELLAYQSDSMNTETWVTKFKRVVKMILAKVGINVGKNDLNDLVDDLYSTGAVRENLTATKILRGEEAVLSEEEKLTARAREIKAKMEAPRGESAIINPDKFKYANEILRNNNVSEDVIKDITKTLSTEERIAPVSDLMIPLESVFSLKYPAKDLQQRLKHLARTNLEEYLNLVSFTETAERLYNLDIEEYPGREDINTGNAIHDLEEQIVGILGPVEIEEDAGPEYSDEGTWLNAWSEPKKKGIPKKRTIEEAFGDAVNNQTGVDPDNEQQYNETGAAYTSPSSQEQTEADDAAQQEYTGSDETSRPKARERTTLRSLWGFLYSQAAQTVRRHSGASKTAGVIADTVLRAPHHKLREKETKSGRDYVQKKSMALGEFRFEIQQQIDALTNRGGVISRKINQQLTDFFSRGIIPENGKVAEAAEKLKAAVEKIYAWSDKTGKKHTEDFSLRPLDGGVFPRVFDVDKVASPEGRKTLMNLLNSIGIVDDAANNKYDATDAYNIILSSGGFVSGDFTVKARLDGESSIKSQQELFEKIEREISREQLGDLLLNDYQAIIPRFIDKAIEKTVYAELFGHRNENLNELKRNIRKEVAEHNRKNAGTTLINVEDVIKDVDELMDIINHRYKVNTIPTKGRKVLQSAMNATTIASLTLVSLASMPEFLTATALGTKNPAKFATNILGASTFAVLRGLNGMHKLLTGKAMKGYFNPKTRMGKRAAMLRQLGLYDLANLGEAAAQRYVGPSFIKAGVGSTGNSFPIKALYKLYGLGNLEKGRFRARQVRAMLNMDVYFEVTALTTMTQMQQLMALTNLNQNIVSDAKALSKAKKGKGFKLDSTVAQIKSNLKSLGLSNSEINELVRWYDAGHRQIHDVPPEFRLDLAGPAHRFVQSVVTLPSEGSLPKVFRDPRFAPFLLFKSFITTFGNTFINTIAQRVRFAEGKGVSKKYQQSKQIAGMFGTAAAMYGAVQFAQAIAYLIKHGDDENPWEEKTPDWAKFIQDFERTGLMGPLGSVAVQIGTPNYWSWQGKDPYDDMLDYIIGPMGKQFRNIGKAGADVAQGKELDLEGRLARAIPLTKSKPIREALGVDPYYTKDKKGKLIRKRTLERREEKKAETKEAKRQELLDSITNDAAKRIKLSKDQIVDMDRRELDKHMRTKLGFDPDGRKSKASMINQYLKSQGADQSSFLKSEESESYRRKHEALQKVRESAKERYKGMTSDERRKEYLSTNNMNKKEFDEYVEVEFGILLDGRKSRDDMNKQFHEVTKGWLKN